MTQRTILASFPICLVCLILSVEQTVGWKEPKKPSPTLPVINSSDVTLTSAIVSTTVPSVTSLNLANLVLSSDPTSFSSYLNQSSNRNGTKSWKSNLATRGGIAVGGSWSSAGPGNLQKVSTSTLEGSSDWSSIGVAFDLSQALIAFGGFVIFLSLSALIYPLVANRNKGKGGEGAGWDQKGRPSNKKSMDFNVNGNILNGLEKFYELYG